MSCSVLTLTSNWSCFCGPAGDVLSLSCVFSSTQQLSVFSGGKATAVTHRHTHTKIKENAWGWERWVQSYPGDISLPSSVACKLLLPSLASAIKMCHTSKCPWLEINLHSWTPYSFCFTACVLNFFIIIYINIYISNVIFFKAAQAVFCFAWVMCTHQHQIFNGANKNSQFKFSSAAQSLSSVFRTN